MNINEFLEYYDVKPKEVRLTLERAKANLKKYGWIKKNFGDASVGFCLIGAIEADSRGRSMLNRSIGNHMSDVFEAAEKALSCTISNREPLVARWNDRQRSVKAVYRLIDRTVEAMRQLEPKPRGKARKAL